MLCTNISGWDSNKDSSVHLHSFPSVCHNVFIVFSDERSVFMEITFHSLYLHSSNVVHGGLLQLVLVVLMLKSWGHLILLYTVRKPPDTIIIRFYSVLRVPSLLHIMKYQYVVKVEHIKVPFVNRSLGETLCNISVLLSCTSSTSSVDITAKHSFSVSHTHLCLINWSQFVHSLKNTHFLLF